jgi:hypothetical protein
MRFVSLGSTYYGPIGFTLDLDPSKMWLHVTNRGIDTGVGDNTNLGIDMYYSYIPVPIPAAVWLFASGLGLLGWLKRKPV